MEWMTVNKMLRDEITKLTCTMIPPGFQGDVQTVRLMQESLSAVINRLGEQSTLAQGLHKVITTAEKLRNSPGYVLYLLKDAHANGGNGEVIGILKVGRKHLFLFDERDRVHEVEPVCVLDFYVERDRQRHGFGRQLFNYMLQDMNTTPNRLAIDGPSPKIEQFLKKAYGIEQLVRQNNNFAVTPQFFDFLDEISKPGCTTTSSTPAVGRFTAPKPNSIIADVIHGSVSQLREVNRKSKEGARELFFAFSEASTEEEAPGPALELVQEPPEPKPRAAPEPQPEEPRGLERPCTLQVQTVTSTTPSPAARSPTMLSPAGSTVSRPDSQLTDKGFFDVKFYHNKLW